MESPQVESANVMTLDLLDNPSLREIFAHKEVGHECKLTFELRVMSKWPEGVQLSIEKVIAEGYGEEPEKEAIADEKEPIMATIKAKNRKNRGMQGPHAMEGGPASRPAQTAENSAEPWLTSYT